MQPKNILIVDDDMEDCEFFTFVVKQINPEITVSTVSSNEELFLHLEQKLPDLLFVDSFIQHESGLASIEKLRKSDRFLNLPIIMYTGSDDLQNVSNAFSAGASSYIVKPPILKEIKAVLENTLHQNWEKSTPKQYYLDGRFHDFLS